MFILRNCIIAAEYVIYYFAGFMCNRKELSADCCGNHIFLSWVTFPDSPAVCLVFSSLKLGRINDE